MPCQTVLITNCKTIHPLLQFSDVLAAQDLIAAMR